MLFRRVSGTLVAALSSFLAQAAAQDFCADLFKQGYYDEKKTFTTQQSFQYIQKMFCSDTAITYQQASSGGFNLGIDLVDLIDVTLGGKTDENSFSSRRTQFCNYSLQMTSSSSELVSTVRTVSTAATSAMAACFMNYPGFSIAVTPKSTLDGFSVTVRGNTGNMRVVRMSSEAEPAQCDTKVPTTVSPPYHCCPN